MEYRLILHAVMMELRYVQITVITAIPEIIKTLKNFSKTT